MFLYQFNTVETLLSKVTSREQVENDPDLCKLLENPYLKDDTELAIRYQEYKRGYPDSERNFVEYFFMHGPEIDVGSLEQWRDLILRDPVLLETGKRVNINTLWAQKQADKKNFSWGVLTDLMDCLSRPCAYLSPSSDLIGIMANTNRHYTAKNNTEIKGTGFFSRTWNKLPKALTHGINQLTKMIGDETSDIFSNNYKAKSDPFGISDAELIGGDLLADIAANLGDCFRLYEHKIRFNPYDHDQNHTGAPIISNTNKKNRKGKPVHETPHGQPINQGSPRDTIPKSSTAKSNSSSSNDEREEALTFESKTVNLNLNTYGGIIHGDKFYYVDNKLAPAIPYIGNNSKIFTIPNSKDGIESLLKDNHENFVKYLEQLIDMNYIPIYVDEDIALSYFTDNFMRICTYNKLNATKASELCNEFSDRISKFISHSLTQINILDCNDEEIKKNGLIATVTNESYMMQYFKNAALICVKNIDQKTNNASISFNTDTLLGVKEDNFSNLKFTINKDGTSEELNDFDISYVLTAAKNGDDSTVFVDGGQLQITDSAPWTSYSIGFLFNENYCPSGGNGDSIKNVIKDFASKINASVIDMGVYQLESLLIGFNDDGTAGNYTPGLFPDDHPETNDSDSSSDMTDNQGEIPTFDDERMPSDLNGNDDLPPWVLEGGDESSNDVETATPVSDSDAESEVPGHSS